MPINCGALPENLIESELFGHRKGAFTGADEHRVGLFQVANGGTLFLDEIGELPKTMQAKLLRFLESGEVRRVGDNEPFTCDVRVICATNRDLADMVADGEFREDLWFRINTFEIPLPPLRERIEDIPRWRGDWPFGSAVRAAPTTSCSTPEALEMLMSHTWPGNVRELANVVEHALILCDSLPIRPEHLPRRFAAPRRVVGRRFAAPRRSISAIARCRRSARRSTATTATSPRPPKNSASASRRSTTSSTRPSRSARRRSRLEQARRRRGSILRWLPLPLVCNLHAVNNLRESRRHPWHSEMSWYNLLRTERL